MKYKIFVRKTALLAGTGALLSSIAVTATGIVTVSASNTPATNGYIAYRELVGSPTAKGITQDGLKAVTADFHINGAPTASADGSKIAWREQTESTKSWAIKVADGDGSNSFTVVGGTWIDPSSAPRNVPPSISPDGTKIVFAHSTGSGQNIVTSIYVVDAVSGPTKTPDDFTSNRNSNTANQAVNVGASSDPVFITNTKYAFAGIKGTGTEGCSFIHGIYVTEIASTTSTFLPGSCASSQGVNVQGRGFLSASPDGQYVAYAVYDGISPVKVRLFVSKTDGTGTPLEVFDIPGDTGGAIKPAFSPDGKDLAFGFSYFGANGPVKGIQIATWNNGAAGTPESLSGFTGEPFQMTWLPGNVSLSTTTPAPNPTASTDNSATSDTNTGGLNFYSASEQHRKQHQRDSRCDQD